MSNKKGFTLVELLAVVVVLAILALIIIPIVNGSISVADKESTKRSIEYYADAVQKSAMNHRVTYGTPIYGTFATTNEGHTLTNTDGDVLQVEFLNASVVCQQVIIDETLKVNLIGCRVAGANIRYSYFPGNPVPLVEYGEKPGVVVSGTVDTVGSQISIGSELFYVLSSTSTTVNLLTARNITLSTTSPRQSIDAPKIAYATTGPFDYSTSNLKPYVDAYKTYIESLDVTVSASAIPTMAIIEGLGCASSTCDSAPEWVRSTDYWLQSSTDSSNYLRAKGVKQRTTNAYAPDPNSSEYGSGYEANEPVFGIRPMLTVDKEDIG